MDTSWNPNEYSLEEAVVMYKHPAQEQYHVGDNVLIDFAVFTEGKYMGHHKHTAESRFISREGDMFLYWLKDPLHDTDTTEIFGVISEVGHVKPVGDVVIIYPQEKPKEFFERKENLYLPVLENDEPFFAKVYASPVDEISAGDVIYCEGGLNPEIRFRGITLEYINLPYIIGLRDDREPNGIRLW